MNFLVILIPAILTLWLFGRLRRMTPAASVRAELKVYYLISVIECIIIFILISIGDEFNSDFWLKAFAVLTTCWMVFHFFLVYDLFDRWQIWISEKLDRPAMYGIAFGSFWYLTGCIGKRGIFTPFDLISF